MFAAVTCHNVEKFQGLNTSRSLCRCMFPQGQKCEDVFVLPPAKHVFVDSFSLSVLFSPVSPAFTPSWSSSLVYHVATFLYGSLWCLQMLKIHPGRRAHEFNIGVM